MYPEPPNCAAPTETAPCLPVGGLDGCVGVGMYVDLSAALLISLTCKRPHRFQTRHHRPNARMQGWLPRDLPVQPKESVSMQALCRLLAVAKLAMAATIAAAGIAVSALRSTVRGVSLSVVFRGRD